VKSVSKHIEADSAILDGEAIAYDFSEKEYFPFQKIMNRRRKYDIEEYAEKIPVKYMVFDMIYKNGSSYLRKNYTERTEEMRARIKNRG
jgi:DNA ligase-1